MQVDSLLQRLSESDFDTLCSHAQERHFETDQLIFEEGEEADEFFFVKTGSVSIYIQQYHRTEPISVISKGNCFGEMAILNNSSRTASAKSNEKTTLLCLDRASFRSVLQSHPEINQKLRDLIQFRSEEMALKESIQAGSGFEDTQLQLSIKGDPSLRETVFERTRYDSLVDGILTQLVDSIESMLIERNVFRVVVNFNSGEVEAYTLFNPFSPEVHAANRLVSDSYLDRHFAKISYDDKSNLIRQVYRLLADNPVIADLAEKWPALALSSPSWETWQPVPVEKLRRTLSRLEALRSLENYYLRNFSVCTVNDVIRMQFNCDGTHIVSSEAYQRFMEENL